MFEGPARNSFRYALSPELLKLYAATIVGWYVAGHSQTAFLILPEPFESIVGLPFLLLGLALLFGGVVGVLHRVVADATAE